MKTTRIALCGAAALFASLLGTPSARGGALLTGSIVGVLYGPGPVVDGLVTRGAPLPNAFVFLQSEDGLFQMGAITDGAGDYLFPDLPAAPPGTVSGTPEAAAWTYVLSAPGIAAPFCPYVMAQTSPETGDPIVLPGGLLLPPGPPSDVDLQAPASCALVSPAGRVEMAENVLGGGCTLLRTSTGSLAYNRNFTRTIDGLSFGYDPPWYGGPTDLPIHVKYVVGTNAGTSTTTSPGSGVGIWQLTDTIADGDEVQVYVDPVELHALGYVANSPTSYTVTKQTDRPPVDDSATSDGFGNYPALEFQVVPIYPQEGHVFADLGTSNLKYDPATDAGLSGVELAIYDQTRAPTTQIATTTTDGDGHYRFSDLPPGYYRIEVLTPPPSAPHRTAYVQIYDAQAPDADFRYLPDAAPRVPCAVGDLHEVTFDVHLPVSGAGDAIHVGALLWDGPGSRKLDDAVAGVAVLPFSGPTIGGGSHLLTIEQVEVLDGLATIRLHVVAQGPAFPNGSFGASERRLEVFARSTLAQLSLPLRSEDLPLGGVLSAQSRDGSSGPSTFVVVDDWCFDSWLESHPAPDLATSSTADLGIHRVDLEVDVPSRVGLSTSVGADVTAATTPFDDVLTSALRLPWSGSWSGVYGRAFVTSVRRSTTGVVVGLRLVAPDESDGTPGALPDVVYTLSFVVGGRAWTTTWDDTTSTWTGSLGSGSPVRVMGYQSVADAIEAAGG